MVDHIALDPAHQRTGVGKAVLEHAQLAARQAGFDSIHPYIHERMTENLVLYIRIGYTKRPAPPRTSPAGMSAEEARLTASS